MKRHKRKFSFELAEFYGLETVEMDPEPHRHVQALTTPSKAQFPGGGSKQHYVSLAGRMQNSFVGTVKIPETPAVPAKPVPLRQISKSLVFFLVGGGDQRQIDVG